MALTFIRIELKGKPGGDVYDVLHAKMEKLGWSRRIDGTAGSTPLPSAMYQGDYNRPVAALAKDLHETVVLTSWFQGGAVLVMRAGTDWAQQGWWEPEH